MKESLEAIIDVSRQLLSQLELQMNDTITSNDENVLNDNLSIDIEQKKLGEERLFKLLSERQSLMTQLFETYTQEQLSAELVMVNEVVTFNTRLMSLSQNNKQVLAQQITKLKKSNKVKDLYQKY
jgi:hypothetical protein